MSSQMSSREQILKVVDMFKRCDLGEKNITSETLLDEVFAGGAGGLSLLQCCDKLATELKVNPPRRDALLRFEKVSDVVKHFRRKATKK